MLGERPSLEADNLSCRPGAVFHLTIADSSFTYNNYKAHFQLEVRRTLADADRILDIWYCVRMWSSAVIDIYFRRYSSIEGSGVDIVCSVTIAFC